MDPLDQFPSGYTGMGNDPANLIDPTGMETKVNPVTDVMEHPRKYTSGEGDSGFGDIDAIKENAWYLASLYGEEKESLFPSGGMSAQGEGSGWVGVRNSNGVITWTYTTGVSSAEQAQNLRQYSNMDVVDFKQTHSFINTAGKQTYLWADGSVSYGEDEDENYHPLLNSWGARGTFYGLGVLSMPIPKSWLGFGTWGNASGYTTAFSYGLSKAWTTPISWYGKRSLYTHTLNGVARKASTWGRFFGRWGSRIGGRISIYYFYYDFYVNVAMPMADGMERNRQSNIAADCWICNLPH